MKPGQVVSVVHRGRDVVGTVGRVVDTPSGMHFALVLEGRLVWFGPEVETWVVR